MRRSQAPSELRKKKRTHPSGSETHPLECASSVVSRLSAPFKRPTLSGNYSTREPQRRHSAVTGKENPKAKLMVPFKRPVAPGARGQAMYGQRVVRRAPVLSFLQVPKEESVLFRAFKTPCPPGMRTAASDQLLRRKRLGTVGGMRPGGKLVMGGTFQPPSSLHQQEDEAAAAEEETFPSYVPLVLWSPPAAEAGDLEEADETASHVDTDSASAAVAPPPVVVPPFIGHWLRPHQRAGVQFVFECVTGARGYDGCGCILADDMGLGKTLQALTLLYTLACDWSPGPTPRVRRALVVCPTSLVGNWENEVHKWLGERMAVIALSEACRADVQRGIDRFLAPSRGGARSLATCLVISYDTFRLHVERFAQRRRGGGGGGGGERERVGDIGGCDLLICDEAHRLKNGATLTNKALARLACRRRVLLSGTPMQNDLDEFFAMVDFANPDLLGTPNQFRRHYALPILRSREPDASDKERTKGEGRSAELSALVNKFILRRTNTLLSAHLPPKLLQVVCCRPTQLQRDVYAHFLKSKAMRALLDGRQSRVLASITALKQLCNHPQLTYDSIRDSQRTRYNDGSRSSTADDSAATAAHGFADCAHFFNADLFGGGGGGGGRSGRRGGGGGGGGAKGVCRPELSGKMDVLCRMLELLRSREVVAPTYDPSVERLRRKGAASAAVAAVASSAAGRARCDSRSNRTRRGAR